MTAVLHPSVTTAPSPPAQAPIPFGRLVRVEWRKATDTRAARWLLAISAAATALIMLVPLIASKNIDQTWATYLQFTAFGLTTLLPVVAILTLTTEWTQRTVLTTFTQEPRRDRVIGAKVTVALMMAVGAIVWAAVVTAIAGGIADAIGRHLVMDLGVANTIGFVAFVLVNIMMGVAFGALLHNTAAAIVLFFILPTLFGILGSAVKAIGHWLDTGTTFNWLMEGKLGGHEAQIAVSVLVWVVVPLVAGLVRTSRREIS